MELDLKRLVSIMEKMLRLYEELQQVSLEKKIAMVHLDLAGVRSALSREEMLVERLKNVDDARFATMKRIGESLRIVPDRVIPSVAALPALLLG